ncbi:TPA: glycosyltransferase family 2 protein [Photobacterium damselae]
MNVSIIITTKNRNSYLKRALASVFSSTIFNEVSTSIKCEVIVVNDGGSIENDIRQKNVIFIDNKISLGGNAARNQGIKASSGDIIFFLDDDDAYTPESIFERFKLFDNPDVVLAFTGINFVSSNNLNLVLRKRLPYTQYITSEKLLAKGNLIGSTSCVAVRRSAIFEAGLFDENVVAMQDYELWIRIAELGEISHDNQCNLLYTIHVENNQLSSKYDRYLDAGLYIYNKNKNKLCEYKLTNKFLSNIYLRVAISSSGKSEMIKVRYAIKSIVNYPNIKALLLLFPTCIIKKFKDFV